MDFHGTEWALPLFEIAMVVVPIYAFVSGLKRVKRNALTKTQAFRRYAAWVISPVIVYTLFVGALLGLDELTGIGLLSEVLARTFFIAGGLGIVVWLVSITVFGTTLLVVKRPTLVGGNPLARPRT